jgi:hypothetical protein
MRRCLKGLGGRPTSTDGFILGPVTRLSGSACFSLHVVGHLARQLYPAARQCVLLAGLAEKHIVSLPLFLYDEPTEFDECGLVPG